MAALLQAEVYGQRHHVKSCEESQGGKKVFNYSQATAMHKTFLTMPYLLDFDLANKILMRHLLDESGFYFATCV